MNTMCIYRVLDSSSSSSSCELFHFTGAYQSLKHSCSSKSTLTVSFHIYAFHVIRYTLLLLLCPSLLYHFSNRFGSSTCKQFVSCVRFSFLIPLNSDNSAGESGPHGERIPQQTSSRHQIPPLRSGIHHDLQSQGYHHYIPQQRRGYHPARYPTHNQGEGIHAALLLHCIITVIVVIEFMHLLQHTVFQFPLSNCPITLPIYLAALYLKHFLLSIFPAPFQWILVYPLKCSRSHPWWLRWQCGSTPVLGATASHVDVHLPIIAFLFVHSGRLPRTGGIPCSPLEVTAGRLPDAGGISSPSLEVTAGRLPDAGGISSPPLEVTTCPNGTQEVTIACAHFAFR